MRITWYFTTYLILWYRLIYVIENIEFCSNVILENSTICIISEQLGFSNRVRNVTVEHGWPHQFDFCGQLEVRFVHFYVYLFSGSVFYFLDNLLDKRGVY